MAETTAMSLVQTGIDSGQWQGELRGAGEGVPGITASHRGREIEGVEVRPVPGTRDRHLVTVPIPAWSLNEGVQTYLVQQGETVLARFTLVAGEPLEDDLRAELGQLRAELDLLKRAFQRHVRES